MVPDPVVKDHLSVDVRRCLGPHVPYAARIGLGLLRVFAWHRRMTNLVTLDAATLDIFDGLMVTGCICAASINQQFEYRVDRDFPTRLTDRMGMPSTRRLRILARFLVGRLFISPMWRLRTAMQAKKAQQALSAILGRRRRRRRRWSWRRRPGRQSPVLWRRCVTLHI